MKERHQGSADPETSRKSLSQSVLFYAEGNKSDPQRVVAVYFHPSYQDSSKTTGVCAVALHPLPAPTHPQFFLNQALKLNNTSNVITKRRTVIIKK